MRRVDNAPVYHDPYRWARGPRRADRILDVPGPRPQDHAQSLAAQQAQSQD